MTENLVQGGNANSQQNVKSFDDYEKDRAAERRRYALLQAAAMLGWSAEKLSPQGIQMCVDEAEALLAEIESREK